MIRLRKWVVTTLETLVTLWIAFVATTIESLGNHIYDTILVVFTAVALASIAILNKYSGD